MFSKVCVKCGKEFSANNNFRKFCCKSCANSYNTTARRIEDNSLFSLGLNKTNAYVLGLIYSDGCLSFDSHSHRYKITISLNDLEIMEQVHELMTPNKKLYRYKHPKGRRTSYSVISSNEDDINFLRQIGVTERKSSNVTFPSIPEIYLNHFIRGYFDGDGSVYINKTKTNWNGVVKNYSYVNASFTTGSSIFAKQLADILINNNIHATIVKDSRTTNSSWHVKIYEKISVKKFYELLYHDAQLYMERKHSKFIEMI